VAASRAGISTVGLLTGGYGKEELRDAGALGVYASLDELTGAIPEWLRTLDGASGAGVAE
jgi:phosphoglycolate phosphatase-like HAD superfamily hydrolase